MGRRQSWRRENRVVLKCKAIVMAEKKAPVSSGETHQHKNEVGFTFYMKIFVL